MTRIVLLTPPGTAAIAVIAVIGPQAWAMSCALFRPAGRPLPTEASPNLHRFGRIGDGAGDEVMLFAPDADRIEIHCHGGRQVVRWLTATLAAAGAVEVAAENEADRIEWMLSRAPTLRWASLLLDQFHGAYRNTLTAIHADLHNGKVDDAQVALDRLVAFTPITKHLTMPFTIALAGRPNVGKSRLMNVLAGYRRSIVSPTAGTTRDLVTQELAFDGVPVRLIDTAGIRDDAEALEAEGIARSVAVIAQADLVLQLYDADGPVPSPIPNGLRVRTKIDLVASLPDELGISSVTGDGISAMIAAIVRRLVPAISEPGEAVPTDAGDLPDLAAALAALPHDPNSATVSLNGISRRFRKSDLESEPVS